MRKKLGKKVIAILAAEEINVFREMALREVPSNKVIAYLLNWYLMLIPLAILKVSGDNPTFPNILAIGIRFSHRHQAVACP